ncbi:MAG: hypothetical protein Phyf2KO_19230 [Phycisphaerales bacterium]
MFKTRSPLSGILTVSVALGMTAKASADISTPYQLVDTFSLPGNTYDLLPDGRLIGIDSTGAVSVQSAPNSSTYSVVGNIGQVNSSGFDPAFVSLSPDGSTLAVGNNEFSASNAVLFFDAAAAMSGTTSAFSSINTPNFKADWSDNDTLYVSGADSATFGTVVNRLDVSAGTSTTVLEPVGAFSGSVGVHDGNVYAGEGDTGDVYAFDLATLDAATNPVNVQTGTFIASSTSAGSIDFDNLGNIVIAGGVFDFGSGSTTGSATVFDLMSSDSQVLVPAGNDTFYGAYFNDTTGQLVVTADGTAYVFAVPAPSAAAPMALAIFACRRRRRSR